uniref:Serine/threonine-protein phosphatase 4 regulatory subunit 3A-like isoform X4 n=1 Tax=Rhizophora mucronata TaxID=61149 RepID=A0A2P2MU61_RHIMU
MTNSSPNIFSKICVLLNKMIPLTILNIMWRPSMFFRSSQILKSSISFWKKSWSFNKSGVSLIWSPMPLSVTVCNKTMLLNQILIP